MPTGELPLREVVIAAALFLWRATVLPLPDLPRDFLAILAAYWIFTALCGRTRAFHAVTVGTMTWLLLLAVYRQLPHAFATLGLRQ